MSDCVPAASVDVTTEIAAVLRTTYGRAGGWHILMHPDVNFGEQRLRLDVAGWRRERLPALPRNGSVDVVPDWICELRGVGYVPRMELYKRAGVQWVWRVFIEDGVIEALRNVNEGWQVLSAHGDDIARVEPFEDVAFEFDRLFGDYPARLSSSPSTSLHSTPASTISTER